MADGIVQQEKGKKNGTSKLKWLFRQEMEHGNGWVAFGDTDTQEYVDDANNMTVVDFNTLANIEPAVVNAPKRPEDSSVFQRYGGRRVQRILGS